MLSEQQRKNIGRGVRKAFLRKRQSEAMKASWARRANGSTPTPDEPTPKPAKKTKVAVERKKVICCPLCGCNIKNVELAVNFGNDR